MEEEIKFGATSWYSRVAGFQECRSLPDQKDSLPLKRNKKYLAGIVTPQPQFLRICMLVNISANQE
jgi:hypothetical protein